MHKIIVTNCIDCPFIHSGDHFDGYYCKLGKMDIESQEVDLMDVPKMPKNCPLKSNDLLISLNKK
jgi:hypothetical protein